MGRIAAKNKPKRAPKPPKGPPIPKPPAHERSGDVDASAGFDKMPKDLLDRFIIQYPKDWNAPQALLRAGYEPRSQADLYSRAGMCKYNVYVAQQLQKTQDKIDAKQLASVENIVRGLHKEAHYTGLGAQHGARVAAWRAMGEVAGTTTKKVELTAAMRGGILIVPDVAKLDEWEKRASLMQNELKNAVKK